ncbi:MULTISPECIES: DUF2790 domain-containing protein [Pseudomonas]|uniref:DUF2790 domain-containing protein n=1 Tax=Pseudomonas luteola TaxID=47886 RepID=A0ABS0FU72_PSELU|nr:MULTISPECIES: DUF2790 domain-containing protein [Pseudomonas]MBA1250449.1 DUF2790 domain-containing protein [Pseudomonas zeshuii]MBF8643902.1 DUF2790 domain-containing protein [Pseudomonas zeshuii]MBW5415208.1 DUF2790 domain-containing protein [Pseudomonas sp. MAG002Y]MCG7373939.1 DUF2790 domain-containing protein [Pseudomonas luteola]RRW40543.1 DUF2790 domain-containing protein [Pseudomonas luteola]
MPTYLAKIFTASLLMALPLAALADNGGERVFNRMQQARVHVLQNNFSKLSEVERVEYQYGMKLDIQEVLFIGSNGSGCGVQPAEMVYKDAAGDVKAISYRTLGLYCSNQN